MAEQDKFEAMEIRTRKQIEEQERLKKRKKTNYIVGFSILGVAIIALIVIYVLAAQIWLVDISMLPYVEYTYASIGDDTTAVIRKVIDNDKKPAPKNFTIPTKVNGITVSGIDKSAFAGCNSIESIYIPDTVKNIGEYAFAGCENLKEIRFPAHLDSLGSNAFKYTPFYDNQSENGVYVAGDILYRIGKNKIPQDSIVLASPDSKVPEQYASYNKFYISSIDDATITGWGESLFADNENIVYAEVPELITELPKSSFENCSNLKEVSFEGKTSVIGEHAFAGASKLEKVNLYEQATTIGKEAFEGTAISEIDLPETLTNIGTGLFKNCKKLVDFTWPSNLASIPDETFMGCTSLANIDLSEAFDKITYIGISAFEKTALTEFKFPIHVSTLSAKTFRNATNLTKVGIYESKTYFDKDGIRVVDGVQSLGADLFRNTKVNTVYLYDENGHATINEGEVRFPNSLTSSSSSSSEGYTFSGDETGAPIEKFIFPYNLVSTSKGMFENCKNLNHIEFNTYHKGGRTAGLKIIESNTFKNCDNLVKLPTLPVSIEKIYSYAFSDMDKLEEIILPSEESNYSVVETGLFSNSTNLKHVEIPSNIFAFKKDAFTNCFGLDYLLISNSEKKSAGHGKKPLSIVDAEKRSFFNCREGVREWDPETKKYGDVIKFIDDNEKMPIFLNFEKDELNPSTMIPAKLKPNGNPNNPEDYIDYGWYDPFTCKPYYLGEWHMSNEGPVIGGEK